MYIDVKVSMWQRITLPEDMTEDKALALVKSTTPGELFEMFSSDWETLDDTEQYVSLDENQTYSTRELRNDDCMIIWENGM